MLPSCIKVGWLFVLMINGHHTPGTSSAVIRCSFRGLAADEYEHPHLNKNTQKSNQKTSS
eukprot:m.297183 g.297183  ORF g.297183 m.297183 type:complete len:60 (+) comp270950_c0_seq1:27-206(+)